MEEFFKRSLNDSHELASGDFLIAEPMLGDPNFSRSVILVCEHNAEGSFGFVLNKESELTIEDATEEMFSDNILYVGGPVEQNTLHFIHTMPSIENAVPLGDGVFWGGDYNQLQQLNSMGMVSSENCRFFVGYSGWAPGQLKQELEQEAWVIARKSPQILFNESADNLWAELLRGMGERYKLLANYPLDPRLN